MMYNDEAYWNSADKRLSPTKRLQAKTYDLPPEEELAMPELMIGECYVGGAVLRLHDDLKDMFQKATNPTSLIDQNESLLGRDWIDHFYDFGVNLGGGIKIDNLKYGPSVHAYSFPLPEAFSSVAVNMHVLTSSLYMLTLTFTLTKDSSVLIREAFSDGVWVTSKAIKLAKIRKTIRQQACSWVKKNLPGTIVESNDHLELPAIESYSTQTKGIFNNLENWDDFRHVFYEGDWGFQGFDCIKFSEAPFYGRSSLGGQIGGKEWVLGVSWCSADFPLSNQHDRDFDFIRMYLNRILIEWSMYRLLYLYQERLRALRSDLSKSSQLNDKEAKVLMQSVRKILGATVFDSKDAAKAALRYYSEVNHVHSSSHSQETEPLPTLFIPKIGLVVVSNIKDESAFDWYGETTDIADNIFDLSASVNEEIRDISNLLVASSNRRLQLTAIVLSIIAILVSIATVIVTPLLTSREPVEKSSVSISNTEEKNGRITP